MIDAEQTVARRPLPSLGFRRIESVNLIVDERGFSAEVTGVTHRLPRTIPVSVRTACRLIEAGAYSRVEFHPSVAANREPDRW
jgi:hypothetical protein